MEKDEIQIYSILNQTRINLMKLKNTNSKINTFSKFNYSRNLFLKNTEETPPNPRTNKKSIFTNRTSKDIQNKSEDFKINTNSILKRKTFFINKVKFDTNYLRKISNKNNIKINELKNNENIFGEFKKSQIKERKIDFINYQFLLGQKNYFKKIFQHYDFSFPTYSTKRIYPFMSQDSKKYYDENKLKNNSFEQDELNSNSMKDETKKFTISSYRNRNSHNEANFYRINNDTKIKFKKYSAPDIKKLNEMLFEYNKRKNNSLIENEKIIDDNYNEYLKGISSTVSNKSRIDVKRLSCRKHKNKIKNLKNYILLYDKYDIYHNIKKINNNNSNTMIKKNNKFFKIKKFVFNRSQNMKNINRSVSIENPIIRNRIKPEKIVV
jgi:hypothetical protein